MMRSKVSRNFVLLAPPSCGEVSANKSANVGALIFIVTLFGSVLIIAYHPPFVQRFLKYLTEKEYYEGKIDPKNGADWNQSAPVDTQPKLEDFKKTISDYLTWEITNLLKNDHEEDFLLGK